MGYVLDLINIDKYRPKAEGVSSNVNVSPSTMLRTMSVSNGVIRVSMGERIKRFFA
ncbi:MAG TPA: hypothetical protein VJ373_01685 [Desulfatiglandales bacterium]|nr:hypothetical protein [Desulfatiglandales bacterium]